MTEPSNEMPDDQWCCDTCRPVEVDGELGPARTDADVLKRVALEARKSNV